MDAAKRMASWKDYTLCSLVALLWIVPIIFHGLTDVKIPYFPRTLSHLIRISKLFHQSQAVWSSFVYQVLPDGGVWTTLDLDDYSVLEPFGHRRRLDRIVELTASDNPQPGFVRREVLAEWIRDRYQALNPQDKLLAVRFLYIRSISGSEIATPAGYWRNPDLRSVTPDRVGLLSTHPFAPSSRVEVSKLL